MCSIIGAITTGAGTSDTIASGATTNGTTIGATTTIGAWEQ
jgi:hypothetical protein